MDECVSVGYTHGGMYEGVAEYEGGEVRSRRDRVNQRERGSGMSAGGVEKG